MLYGTLAAAPNGVQEMKAFRIMNQPLLGVVAVFLVVEQQLARECFVPRRDVVRERVPGLKSTLCS